MIRKAQVSPIGIISVLIIAGLGYTNSILVFNSTNPLAFINYFSVGVTGGLNDINLNSNNGNVYAIDGSGSVFVFDNNNLIAKIPLSSPEDSFSDIISYTVFDPVIVIFTKY